MGKGNLGSVRTVAVVSMVRPSTSQPGLEAYRCDYRWLMIIDSGAATVSSDRLSSGHGEQRDRSTCHAAAVR